MINPRKAYSDISCDFKNLIMICFVRHLDDDGLADARSDQGLPQRGFVRDLAVHAVGLRRADDGELQLFIIIHVQKLNLAADIDCLGIRLIFKNDFGMLKDQFDLLDARFNVTLFVLGGIVLGILGKIALLAGFTYLLGDLAALVDLKIRQFIFQFFKTGVRKDIFLHLRLFTHLI